MIKVHFSVDKSALARLYPNLAIPFGLHTYDGWYWLVRTLLSTLDSFYKDHPYAAPVVFAEIKQKMGSLEIRHNYFKCDPVASDLIHGFERASLSACTRCCSIYPGGYTRPWVMPICEGCVRATNSGRNLQWVTNHERLDLTQLERVMHLIAPSVYKDRLEEMVAYHHYL